MKAASVKTPVPGRSPVFIALAMRWEVIQLVRAEQGLRSRLVASCAFKCSTLLIIWDGWNLSKTYSFHYKVSAEVGVESKRVAQPPHIKGISMRWLAVPTPSQ